MCKKAIVQKLEQQQLKKDVVPFRVGDTVRVHIRIIEGDKERIQIFMGTVIARSGYGISETFSVHRHAYGEGMERVFMVHSPRIAKIEVVREGRIRRAKLYYLRGTSGKKSRVKSRMGGSRAKAPGMIVEDIAEENVSAYETTGSEIETTEGSNS